MFYSVHETKAQALLQPHEFLYASLRRRDVGFEVHKEFNVEGLFVGASLTLHVSGCPDAAHALKLILMQDPRVRRNREDFFSNSPFLVCSYSTRFAGSQSHSPSPNILPIPVCIFIDCIVI
jgi:hypothetical protein